MTCLLFKDRVGYRGQRYEVRFKDETGTERVFGWQNEPKAGLAQAARLHPGWTAVQVVDLCTCNIDKSRRRAHIASCQIRIRQNEESNVQTQRPRA